MGSFTGEKEIFVINRTILTLSLFVAASAALGAQQASPYSGVSNPPADDTIVTSEAAQAKPSPAHRAEAQPAATAQPQPAAHAATATLQVTPQSSASGDGTDAGIVQVAQTSQPTAEPALVKRSAAPDPDGDIVHPAPLGPNELGEGTIIRVRLLNDLSSSFSQQGEVFRGRVASDVVQGDHVLIPAGSVIDGRVVDASTGHFGGHGSLYLNPEKLTLPNGASYKLNAEVNSTPGSHAQVGAEGEIGPDSQLKRNGLEYAGGVGGGAVTGALLGGPVGALAGGLVGAGLVTTHLLVSHPQVSLDSGSVLILTVSESMHLVPIAGNGR